MARTRDSYGPKEGPAYDMLKAWQLHGLNTGRNVRAVWGAYSII